MRLDLGLSEYARSPVRPWDFWVAVAVGTAIVCGICLTPGLGPLMARPWPWAVLLAYGWAMALLGAARHGGGPLLRGRGLYLLGLTLFAGGHLWRHLLLAPAAQVAGMVVLVVTSLWPFVTTRRPATGMDEGRR